MTQVVSYTKYLTEDLITLICIGGVAATVLAVICREYFFAIYKGFLSVNFSFMGMLSNKTVVLDDEGFRHRKEQFLIKKLGVCTEDHLDLVSFLPDNKLK